MFEALAQMRQTAADRLKAKCPHGDPWCPCQDGLLCHYEDDPQDICAEDYECPEKRGR